MDKLALFNEVAKVARPAASEDIFVTSLDTHIKDTNLDSLDMLMLSIYLGDIYGIEEETLKLLQPSTVADLFAFMEEHKTKEPASLEAALASIQ